MKEPTLSPRAFAQTQGFGLGYVYRILYDGRLPATKTQGRWSIRKVDAEAFAKERRRRLGGNADA